MRRVWAAQCMTSVSGFGAIVYSIVWCSAAHAMSKPSASARTTSSSAWSATSSIRSAGSRRVRLTAMENLTRSSPR